MLEVVDREWGEGLVRSWNDWVELPTAAGDLLGQHLAGAAPGQIAVCDSTTVNLYKLAHAALDARPGRDVLITDDDNFPTDRYVLAGVARERGCELRLIHTDIDQGISAQELAAALDDRVPRWSACRTWPTAAARWPTWHAITAHGARGRRADAVGPVPRGRRGAGRAWTRRAPTSPSAAPTSTSTPAPASPAFLYVRRELQDQLRQPVWGWFGQARPVRHGPGLRARAW